MLLDPRLPVWIRRALPFVRKDPTMTDPITRPDAPERAGKVERKTTAAATGAYVGAFVVLAVLSNVSTDMVHSLPDWLEVPVYALLPSAVAFLSGYVTRHRADSLSASALQAVLGRYGPR